MRVASWLAATVALAGCYRPDLVEGQYRCTHEDRRCPAGFACDPCSLLCLLPERSCVDGSAGSEDAGGCAVPCFGACCGAGQVCAPAPASSCCTPVPGDDLPDDAFADGNCDGIDGDRGQAVLVDPELGDDASGTGLDGRPVRTIAAALSRAAALGRRQILVAKGGLVEVGPLRLPPSLDGKGYGIWGGYVGELRRAELPHPTLLGAPIAVVAADLAAAVTWDRVDVKAASAAVPGTSSAAFLVSGGTGVFTARHATLVAGDGAPGAPGSDGTDSADGIAATAGTYGCTCDVGNGCAIDCSRCVPAPESPAPVCLAGTAFVGGPGGACRGGAGTRGGGPNGGCAGLLCPGGAPSGGSGGEGGSGAPGAAGAAFGALVSAGYRVASGGPGGDGLGGSGGGGGATTILGTCNLMPCMNLRISEAGPAGGSGGCGGVHGGGGAGGGGSFGVLIVGAHPRLDTLTITTGRGGNGGAGGTGSAGRAGGAGARNGNVQGGAGGRGGSGGGGGGGGGGPSLCVAAEPGMAPAMERVTCTPGKGGSGGGEGGGLVPGRRGADGMSGSGT